MGSACLERMPSLANTLRRCHSTVRGLRKSRAPISGFDRPSRASRAICSSCGGQLVARLSGPLAHVLARGQQLAAGALGERLHADRSRTARGPSAAARGRRRGDARGAATPRRGGARARGRAGVACAPGGRWLRGTGARRPRPRSAARATRACRPSAQSEPVPSVCSPSRASARRCELGVPGPRGSLDQLAQRPRGDVELRCVLARLDGRRERLLIAAEAVHEHGRSPSVRTGRRCPGRRRWLP